ncbi:hypothetical protein LXL04_010320 [Taraxacum kok-saghyz]
MSTKYGVRWYVSHGLDLQVKEYLCFGNQRLELKNKKEKKKKDLILLRSFENSYIPENPRTPKPLTFSKNRLRETKNRSNTSSVAKKNSEKTIFFSKTFICAKKKIAHVHLRSFENSYIPENPRTPKPLTFSKNRLRGAKNRSNTSPVAKKNSEKMIFFFKNFAYVQKFFLHICKFFCFVLKTLKYLKKI